MQKNERATYGRVACCAVCGQDISFIGKKEWRDRGSNRFCAVYLNKDGEVVRPKSVHKPYRHG